MEQTRVLFEERDGVAVVTLNRPERLNALDTRTIAELEEIVALAWNRPSIRALLLTGAGRAFSAGADVKEWSEGTSQPSPDEDGWATRMHRLIARLYRLPKPVIVAVNGVAVGAGCDLTLVADLRIASTKARFGQAYIWVGYCPDAGGSWLLPRLIGPTKAKELIFTGRIIDCEEANQLGLLNAVVEPEALLDTAMAWATRLAKMPTVAIGLAKENIHQGQLLELEDALRNEHRSGEICARTEDHQEGLRATVEKREPVFVGR